MTPEEQGLELAKQVMAQRHEAIRELQEKMLLEGKYPNEYLIADSWNEVLDGLDKGKLVPYRCWALPLLAANEILK